jgi:hypothetical protein
MPHNPGIAAPLPTRISRRDNPDNELRLTKRCNKGRCIFVSASTDRLPWRKGLGPSRTAVISQDTCLGNEALPGGKRAGETLKGEKAMASGMCPHIFGAWCPHYTSSCSDDHRSTKCIHLPAFMISADDADGVRELERARAMFQGRESREKKSGC